MAKSVAPKPVVTVVIPSFGAKAYITDCLTSLRNQTSGATREVIVVESSDDGTREIIGRDFPEVDVICVNHRCYPGEARNFAFDQAKGDIIVLIDAHNVAPKDWLDQILRVFQNESISVVGGSRLIEASVPLCSKIHYLVEFAEFLPCMPRKKCQILPAGNTAFRRGAIENFRYVEGMRATEDTVMSHQMTQAGIELHFEPKISVYYRAKSTWAESFSHLSSLGYWSAIARRRFEFLPGSTLARYRYASLFLLPYRLAKFTWLMFRFNRRQIPWLLLSSPLISALFASWTTGFFRGLTSNAAEVNS